MSFKQIRNYGDTSHGLGLSRLALLESEANRSVRANGEPDLR